MRDPVDVPSAAALLDACAASRHLCHLRQLHSRLLRLGISHQDFIRTKLCAAYARCSRLRESLAIVSRANRRPAFLFNSLIRSLSDLRRFPDAVGLFRQMRHHTAAPDPRTLAAVLRACAGLPSLHLGRAVHAAAVIDGHASDTAVSNSLVSMYSKCGDMASARQVFDRMSDRRNLVSWTAMITACGDHGRPVEEVMALVEEFLGGVQREQLDAAALTAVLSACARNGLTELGHRVFGEMQEGRLGGVRPGVEHYTCMVELLGRAGCVDEVKHLVEKMEVEPDEGLWRALIATFCAQKE